MHSMIAIAETSNQAFELGQWIGYFLGFAIVGPGLWKCLKIMRRPSTGTLCVLALLLVLIAFAVNLLWGVLMKITPLPAAMQALNLVVVVPLFVAALVLGIVGLAEYDPLHLRQGRKQAVWAMVLSFFGLAGAVATLGMLMAGSTSTEVSAPSAGLPGQEAVREKFNFALKPPSDSWQPVSATSVSPKACAAFQLQPAGLFAAVVAEEHLALVDEGIEPLLINIKANIATQEVREQTQELRQIGPLQFTRIQSRVRAEKDLSDTAMEHWVATHNGFAWQIAMWGKYEQKKLLEEQAEALMQGFRLLDQDRKTPVRDRTVDVDRPAFGYSVRLSDEGWSAWVDDDDDDNSLPKMADLGAQTMASAFLIIPYEHRLDGTPPPPEALARAFLATLDFTYRRNHADFATRPITEPLPGLEITTERESDGARFRYLFRIHQSGHHAWLVGGWTRIYPGSTLNKVRKACDLVQFTLADSAPPIKFPLKQVSPETAAEFINQIGIWHHHRDDNTPAVRYFTEASRLLPGSRTYLENITHALESDNKALEALALMDAAGEREFASDQGFKIRHAWLRLKAGQIAEGAGVMTRLISSGFSESDTVLEWINELLSNDHTSQAREIADAYAKVNPEPRSKLWVAQITARDDTETAVKLLEDLIEAEPEYLQARYNLGEYSNRLGKHERALEQADILEKDGQDTTRLHLMRGWAHMGRKWYREARKSFETAARTAPDDADVKEALQEVSAHLGQGSNLEIKSPIEAVPLPPRVASRMEALRQAPADFGHGHKSALLLWSKAFRFTPQKPLRTTLRCVLRILNEEGAGDYSTIQHNYDPLSERLYVNRVEVLDQHGHITDRAAMDDMYVLDAGGGSQADTDRTVHIQVPGLKPGDILDYEITIEQLSPRQHFPLKRHLFGGGIPTQLEVVSISGATDGIVQHVSHPGDLKITREEESLMFEYAEPPLIDSEEYAQPSETWAPLLILSANGKSWTKVGLDYLAEIKPQLSQDDSVVDKAKELTDGLTEPRDKARALTAFVQKSIRYKAIEFGVRGYIPSPAAQTLRQRYGDCKDQAVLLHQLLGACGIESHLALVDTAWRVETPQPTLDAFNHMVVHLPSLPFPGFIDPTDSHVAAVDHPPNGLWEQTALVLKPDKPALVKIPPPAEDSGKVLSNRRLSLLPPDGLRVEEELTFHGYYASGMRSRFSRQEPKARHQYAQDMLHGFGDFRLEDFEFVTLSDPNLPAVLKLTYVLPNAVESRGTVRKLRLPAAWESYYLRFPFLKDRATPFCWNVPFRMLSEVTFDSSVPLDADALGGLDISQESRFGGWSLKSEGPVLRFDLRIDRGKYAAADYADFRSTWAAAHDLWKKEVTLTAAE